MHKLAITFGKEIPDNYSFEDMGEKRQTYLEFVDMCKLGGFDVKVVSTKNYLGNGIFQMGKEKENFDIAFDRSGGTNFPPPDDGFRVVDSREFKLIAWDKWEAYKILEAYTPKSFLVSSQDELKTVLQDIKGDMVIVKPINGLKGLGIYIGSITGARDFKLNKDRKYLVQEYVETKNGIKGITPKRHDLRVVITNGKIIWSHFRTPPENGLKANVAGGGNIEEIEISKLPSEVIKISNEIGTSFYKRFDNPLFSIDFGIDEKGRPWVFEINDQIGFPKPKMKGKDTFIKELVENFKSKI